MFECVSADRHIVNFKDQLKCSDDTDVYVVFDNNKNLKSIISQNLKSK